MLIFVKKILIHFFILGLINFVILFLIGIKINKKYEISNTSIIVGHSYGECAFNDSVLPDEFKIACHSAEPIIYSLLKLRYLLKKNDKINKAYVVFSNNCPNSLTYAFEERIDYNLLNFYSILNTIDILEIISENPIGIFRSILQLNPIQLHQQYYSGLGEFKTFNKYGLYDSTNIKLIQIKDDSLILTRSRYKFDGYFDQLLQEIVTSNPQVDFVMIRTPLHKIYRGKLANEKEYLGFVNKRTSDFKNLTFKDYSNLQLSDSCYLDDEHLNLKGSVIFSKIFLDAL
jgi:hypothetical protein